MIPPYFVHIIINALDKKELDWPILFHKQWVVELQLISQDLTLDGHITMSRARSYITLLAVALELLKVQHEIDARIFEIPKFLIKPKLRKKRSRTKMKGINKS